MVIWIKGRRPNGSFPLMRQPQEIDKGKRKKERRYTDDRRKFAVMRGTATGKFYAPPALSLQGKEAGEI